MWVIPVDKEESNHEQIPKKRSPKQFSLKPYNQSCYLTCKQSKGGIKAVVCGADNDHDDIDFSGNEFSLDETSS